ncbi:MAG TPA: hypothetical protein VF587_03220 [Solirubrobacteraceae bacterium]|jgi:cation transport ATPase
MTTTLHRINDERIAAGLAMLLVLAATAFANFAGNGDNGGAGPYAVGVVVCGLAAAVLFGRVLPSTDDPARAAWILAALALVTCVVFWSGLPFVFGIGAAYAAARADRAAPAVLGLLAVVLACVGCVVG